MNRPARRHAALMAALLLVVATAQAQCKVVAPDGSVTDTDRPPASAQARVTTIGRQAHKAAAPVNPEWRLPLELRSAVQRHPVTLYTGAPCPACDTARQLLLQRGLPFSERRVSTDEDAVALERLVGARSVPPLTLGSQPLRGFNDADWTRFLDAADDPRQSQLPRNWQAAPTRPLVERSTPATQEPAAPPAGAQPAPAGMRF